jgi:DNA-directed RNA polymerase specialized sigma24 family protein
LKPRDREAILLRVEMGCAYSEVAELLGKPSIPAAHIAVSRALARLAKEMSHERRI